MGDTAWLSCSWGGHFALSGDALFEARSWRYNAPHWLRPFIHFTRSAIRFSRSRQPRCLSRAADSIARERQPESVSPLAATLQQRPSSWL
eukprot:5254865-Prymnesium_polylepis.1